MLSYAENSLLSFCTSARTFVETPLSIEIGPGLWQTSWRASVEGDGRLRVQDQEGHALSEAIVYGEEGNVQQHNQEHRLDVGATPLTLTLWVTSTEGQPIKVQIATVTANRLDTDTIQAELKPQAAPPEVELSWDGWPLGTPPGG
jgi:hypothetical protein